MENKLIFCSTRSFKSPMFYYSKAFILPDFAKQGVFTNAREIPQITEISLHMSLKDSALSPTKLGLGFFILGHLTNQKPTPTFAKKAIATFKLQKKVALGVQTTLRKKKLYTFLDRFVFYILPNSKNFNGINYSKSSNKNVLSLGVSNVFIFHEIEAHYNKLISCSADKRNGLKGLGFQLTFQKKSSNLSNQVLLSTSQVQFIYSNMLFPKLT